MGKTGLLTAGIFAGIGLALGAQTPSATVDMTLRILNTTDVHGQVMPQDTFTLKPENEGWAQLATLIRTAREGRENTLLVDCGDELQGEPINYVRAVLHPELPDPFIAIMNALGYSAMVVGDHDFDFGLPNLRAAQKQASFPLLSANILEGRSGSPTFKPYTLCKVGPLTVAIVGFTTPELQNWEEPSNYPGLQVEDIVATAKTIIPKLRTREKADLVLVAMHSGLGQGEDKVGGANVALRLAEEVPGIDAILTGHTHATVATQHHGVPILQASQRGRSLGVLDLTLRKSAGKWTVVSNQPGTLSPDASTAQDPQVLTLTSDLRRLTDRYLDTMATTLKTDLDGRWSRMEDTAIVQLIQTVMRQATGAQLAAASCVNPKIFIPQGATSVRQFYPLAPGQDRVAVIRITGAQLKAYLEHAASYFQFSWQPALINPAFPGADFDTVDGATYALDLGKPVGDRVQDLKVGGQPVTPDQSFTLALSTFRLRGAGGYMEAIGFSGGPLSVSDRSLRNLLLSFVLAHPDLAVTPDQNWRTIPYLDRERILSLEN